MASARREVGGDSFHISDCYIWAEIYYLDSATDYREYLPQNSHRPSCANDDDLIMLDSEGWSGSVQRVFGWIKKTLFGLLVLLLFASLLSNC